MDSEEYLTQEVEEGAKVTAAEEPTKEGYTFSGWSEIPTTMPAHDVTITGSFTFVDGITGVSIDGKTDGIYTAWRQKDWTTTKGVNIIKTSNRNVKKVFVK